MIDFHCHLDLYSDPGSVTREAIAREIYVLSVTTTPSAWEGTVDLAGTAPRIRTALGLHPQLAHERKHELSLFEELLPMAKYVGEIGLDGSPELKTSWDHQIFVFSGILALCQREGGRILSVHSRRAASAVLDALEAHASAGTAVLHWFSGTQRELARAVALGCWFSVGPAMLGSRKGQLLAAKMPRDRVLTESDGPFARIDEAPAFPWDAGRATEALATLWGMSPSAIEYQLESNLRTLVSHDRFSCTPET